MIFGIPPQLITSIGAGLTYSLKGWFGNKNDGDISKSDFNWTLFTKNVVIGAILGLVVYFVFPAMTIPEMVTAFPVMYILQGFVDKLWTKVF